MLPFQVPKSIEYLEQQLIRDGAVALTTTFDAEPLEVDCMYFNHVMLFVNFVSDAGVNLILRPEYSMDNGVTWYQQSIYNGGVVAAGVDTTSLIQRELFSYGNVDTDDFFMFGIEIAAGIQQFRLPCRHDGDAQDEFECEIYGQFSYK